MTDPTTLAEWITAGLVGLAVLPAGWVLGREALRRKDTKRAREEVAAARGLLQAGVDVSSEPPEELVQSLIKRFDTVTIERAVLALLRDEDAAIRAWAGRIFARLELTPRYATRLRQARKWSERAHAAEVLGLAGASDAIPALAESLRDPTEDESTVKVAAAAALAKLRDPTAIPLLVRELGDPDGRSSRNVAEALVAFGTLAVEPLLGVLRGGKTGEESKDRDPVARVWAARILGRIGDARATDDLVTRLADRDDLLRMAAAEALGAVGDGRALQPLVRATLRDPAPQVRAHAAGAVGKIEGERAVDVLVAALADPDYATRLRALEAFETMRIEDTTPLETALRDANAEVRRRAALALERVGWLDRVVRDLESLDKEVQARAYASFLELGRVGLVDSVVSYVHHTSFAVRALAARAAGELGQARIVPLLVGAADDPSWPVRAAICEALGRLVHEKSVEVLVKRLTDSEESVREAAAEALTNLAPKEIEPHVVGLAAAYDTGTVPIRTHAVVLAARLTGEVADALLVRASEDPSDGVRLRAVTALGARQSSAFVEPLVARLTDASLDVRMAAVTALGSAATPEAFDGLLRALPGAKIEARERISEALSRGARSLLMERLGELEKNPSLDVRLGVAWTLGKTADPEVVPTLARFLRDASAQLRASAAGALAKIDSVTALTALLGAVDDPDGRVRAAVVNALGRVAEPGDAVLSALERRLVDPDAFVRNRALVSLARGGRGAVATRVLGVTDVDPSARLVALALLGTDHALGEALEAIARPGALEKVSRFLEHSDRAMRDAFFGALGLEDPTTSPEASLDDASVVARYEGVLRTSLDVAARRLAVRALAKMRGSRSLEVLGDALASDPDESIRLAAADALASAIGETPARRALLRAISDPNADVAATAVKSLAGRREPDVVRALFRRLGGGDARVQTLVEDVLAEIHRDDATPFLDWFMGVDVPELLVPGIRVLGRMGRPETVPLLRELGRSRAGVVRAAAVHALGRVAAPEAWAAVDAMTQDPHEDVRLAVLDVLASSGDVVLRTATLRRDPSATVRARAAATLERVTGAETKAAIRALEGMLEDGSSVVRAAALASLVGSSDAEGALAFGRAWGTTALDTRLDLRADPRAAGISERLAARLTAATDPDERRVAVTALGAFGARGYEAHVLPALRDPSPEVRVAAVHALASLDDEVVRARLREMLADPDAAVRDVARRTMLRTVR